jgi:hypothetical protein
MAAIALIVFARFNTRDAKIARRRKREDISRESTD